MGKALHKITQQHKIPLIINDRADVAVAVGAEGLHIGQDDMDIAEARKIMGKDAIIGVTANTAEEAITAARAGADYLGIGTVYSTATKENTKSIIGPAGVRNILGALHKERLSPPCVCIGSINPSNVQRVLFQAASVDKSLDGVAVVSAIIGSPDPEEAASSLLQIIHTPPPFASASSTDKEPNVQRELSRANQILRRVSSKKPLNHNMTNLVVQNFAANIALAVGSSPIMSSNGLEAPDLAALGGSLVINMGSVTPDSIQNYLAGIRAYNATGNPVIFDPVGAGATKLRRDATQTLLNEGYFDVIKGNESEIQTVLGETEVVQHGVDSASGSQLSASQKAQMVKTLARREKNVVLMTGKIDYLSDGHRIYAISNGHEYLGSITGSGCTLATTIAACVAVEREDKLNAVLAGVLLYEIAAQRAAGLESVKGPGTFVPALIDEIYGIQAKEVGSDGGSEELGWLDAAKVVSAS